MVSREIDFRQPETRSFQNIGFQTSRASVLRLDQQALHFHDQIAPVLKQSLNTFFQFF
jgi:hypothetical protein